MLYARSFASANDETRMNSASLALAERAAPRYTSYPTAPHFSAAVGPEQTRQWLGELSRRDTLALFPRPLLRGDLRLLRLSHQGAAARGAADGL